MGLHDRIAKLESVAGRPGEWERIMAQEGISREDLAAIARDAIVECEGSGDTATAAELQATLDKFNRADNGTRIQGW